MHTRMQRHAAVLAGILFAAATLLGGQTAPAVDLAGTWTLDTYLSDSPEQVAAAVRVDLGLANPNTESFSLGGGGRRGGRNGGTGNGQDAAQGSGRENTGGNNSRNTAAGRNQLSAEEQARIDEVLNTIRYAPATLTIAQNGETISFTSEPGGTRTYQLAGKKEKQTFGSTTVDAVARADGPQVVITIDLPRDRSVTSSWSIVPTTKQLLLRVTLSQGRLQNGPFQIKQVYNRM